MTSDDFTSSPPSASRREFLTALAVNAAAIHAPTHEQPAGNALLLPEAPSGLMCELMATPERVALTNSRPVFAWIVEDSGLNAVQRAYQIQVSTLRDPLERGQADLWDSGKVSSDASCGVVYAGKPLPANASLFWRVRTWNAHGGVSPFSAIQMFRTGVFVSPRTAVRYPIGHSEVRPVAVVDRGEGRWFLDFGKAAFGRLSLSVPPGKTGQKMTVALGEARKGENSLNAQPGGSIRYQKGAVTSAAPSVLFPEKVMPFRYAEIEGYPGRLDAGSAVQITDHYPFDDTAAHFRCSDPVLNDVWELCKYSIKATSFLGLYIDGDRERKPYEADAYINQLGHYCVDREYTLARYSHEYLMRHATWPTEWPLHSVLIAWSDYLYTGDRSALALYYDDLKAKTLTALAREDGLITTTKPITKEFLASIYAPRLQDIVDWPVAERDGFQFGAINSVVNAFHFKALDLMSRIAAVLGRSEDVLLYRQKAARVRTAFARTFYDPTRGFYRDGEGIEHFSLHASMFALAFGLGPTPDRLPALLALFRQKGMACSVYGAQYLLEALYNIGAADYALELMTARTERSWAHMLYDLGSTITLEAWDKKYKPNLDWNHAWGAAPANIIPRRLMGITPEESSAGFRHISIRPQPARLTQGEIQLPTIAGPLQMRFNAEPGRSFRMEMHLPANTTASIFVPNLGAAPLLDGKKAKGALVEHSGFWRIDNVGSGTHRVESLR